ncbi:beta-N-acetylhexosaminidase [Paenibacillus sp. J22TS3]|uniref:beta-N-acetylhexosaminidase n=1 Tax=Paenibacillus sp. J22TS3 TaxID=2807192 RepID=UPI001B285686|nr:beta-N-acetylhexosaminidase [Paenibacillus sp. J22TS3]GIP20242.1 beta-glucosidase [Paenibacillus sp. J22TS3]
MVQLSKLTLDEKIGQLFICGFHSQTPDEQIKTLIEQYHLGGVIYFRRNVGSASQLADLSHNLQVLSKPLSEIPLFIAIDQEGGMVSRIDHDGVSRIPGNMSLGAAGDLKLTEAAAALGGEELFKLGINLNFAPVVDVNNNPVNPVIGVRSFGEDPKLVAAHGAAAIKGYQNQGVSATAKHFPGHGDTAVDTHLGLAVVPHDKERLEQVELLPFRKAIEVGVDMIMTAHVIFPAFESEEIPATLSYGVLTKLLREELGYEGLIVTDCLEMHAISKSVGIPEGAVKALEAGADLILVSHTMKDQVAAIKAVRAAVNSGRLTEERIDASLERILSLKEKRIGQISDKAPEITVPLTPAEESERILRQIAEKSITLVTDAGNNLPLRTDARTLVIWAEVRHFTEVDEPAHFRYTLGEALAPYFQVDEILIGSHPKSSEISAAIERSAEYSQIVVVTYTSEGRLPEGQKLLIEDLNQRTGGKLIVVSVRNPYDINEIPDVTTYLCAYENRPVTVDAIAKVLVGQIQAEGKLPVTLSSRFPAEVASI